ncbi:MULTISPECIES: branched-chain amino acid ABC transporter permease [unclassified Lacrimispora]|uniref:branched-chain amino acid ABC transporter permease n=1 Tax=unclassified Lacrimispora TaxID=2719232 RepID=UPI00305AB571|nr:branched-chain amino acid ABC transporter permease [Lachnospiraceae bacterium]
MKSFKIKLSPSKLAAVVLLVLLPGIFMAVGFAYGILVSCFAFLYIIAVSGLDIDFGYCGQISMGHAAFFAIGAYGSVMLNKYFHLPILLTMVIASVLATAIGAIIAYPASKLVFHFLSLATIAFGEVVYTFLLNSPGGITGNAVGMFTESVNVFGFKLDSYTKFYYFGLVCMGIFLLAKFLIVNSKVGRAWIAIRENPHAANGMGINVTKYKVIAFAVSAFYTGFAGAMYAHLVRYIGPDTFTQKQSVMFVTMMLFGGTGSLLGPIFGAVFVLLITEGLRMFEQYQMLMYGILLLLVVVALPGGVYGKAKKLLGRFTSEGKGGKAHAS